jgi:hypothetical protein
METSSCLGHSNLAFWVLLDMIVFQHILMCCRSLWVLSNCSRVSAHYSCTNVHSILKFVNFEVWSMGIWYKFLHIEVRFTRVQYKFVLHSPLLFCTFSIFEPYNPNFPQLVGVGRFSVLVLYSLDANISHGTKVLEIQTLLGEEKYHVPLPFKTLYFDCFLDI